MRTIKISDEVWNFIAENGKFGETEDDVLHRLLHVARPGGVAQNGTVPNRQRRWKERQATDRMTNHEVDGKLILKFDSGGRGAWQLPPKDDHSAIRRVRD